MSTTSALPIWLSKEFFDQPLYFTELPVGQGRHQQHIVANFDLQASNTWVASAACKTVVCRSFSTLYDHTASTSYSGYGTPAYLYGFPGFNNTGLVGSESFQIAEHVWLDGHDFVEVVEWGTDDVQEDLVLWDFTAGIGLSLHPGGFYNTSIMDPVLPSIVSDLAAASPPLLEEPVFSLLLPKTESQVGDLSFGKINQDLYKGNLISHPLHPPSTNLWQIAGPEIEIRARNGTTIATYDLTDHIAYLDTVATTSIVVPTDILDAMRKNIGATEWGQVDCNLLGTLPEMILTFGDQEISLGDSYVQEVHDLWGTRRCQPALVDMPQDETFRWVYNWTEPKLVVLGTPFLRSVYSVYNWEERTVSFANSIFDE